MTEIQPPEPFAEYAALLDVRMELSVALQGASSDEAAVLRHDLTCVDRGILQLRCEAGLAESALRWGIGLAWDAAALPAGETGLRDAYVHRLRQVCGFILDAEIGDPGLAEDLRFSEIQIALGRLAAGVTADKSTPAAPARPAPEPEPPKSVDYACALQNLRAHIAMIKPGESYMFSAAQLLTLAAPNMAFSRWQRYRLLRLACQALSKEGFEMRHNGGRGKYSRYVVVVPGRVAADDAMLVRPLAMAV